MNVQLRYSVLALLSLPVLLVGAESLEAQGRGTGGRDRVVLDVTFSIGQREVIREYYASASPSGSEALPPGIRKNLARGKPLPPGIAKKTAPPELYSALGVQSGYEVVEVGLDVFLVEVATGVIHDVLMDVVR